MVAQKSKPVDALQLYTDVYKNHTTMWLSMSVHWTEVKTSLGMKMVKVLRDKALVLVLTADAQALVFEI